MVDGTRGMQSILLAGKNIKGQRDAGDVVQFINNSMMRCVGVECKHRQNERREMGLGDGVMVFSFRTLKQKNATANHRVDGKELLFDSDPTEFCGSIVRPTRILICTSVSKVRKRDSTCRKTKETPPSLPSYLTNAAATVVPRTKCTQTIELHPPPSLVGPVL